MNRLTHRVDEIKRRLSVLEKRLGIKNVIDREEVIEVELNRRLTAIKNEINKIPIDEKGLTESEMNQMLQELSDYESIIGITGNKNPDSPPTRAEKEAKYQVNFIRSEFGNAIHTGEELIVRIKGADSVSGYISLNGSKIQLDQSHENDEDKDAETINFLLKRKSIHLITRNLRVGTYLLHVWFWDKDTKQQGYYKEEFEII